MKAWSGGRWGETPVLTRVDLAEIEVLCDAQGRPSVRLSGALAEAVEATGVDINQVYPTPTVAILPSVRA